MCAFLTPSTTITCPVHSNRFLCHPNNKYCTVRIMQLCITKFSPSICRPCHTFQYPEANPTQAAQQYLVLRLRKEVYGHTKPSAAHKGRNDTPALYNSDTPITVCKLSSDLSCRNLNLMNIQNYYTLMNFWIKTYYLIF